jgi:hypothetical protein
MSGKHLSVHCPGIPNNGFSGGGIILITFAKIYAKSKE